MEAAVPGVLVLPQDPFHVALDRGICLGFCVAEEPCGWVLHVPAARGEAHAVAEAGCV